MKSPTQFLGPICKQNHEFQNTGQSLRRLNGSPAGVCVECFSLYQERYRLGKKREIEIYLGPPCPNGHTEDGQSRRYVSTGNCVECQKNTLATTTEKNAMNKTSKTIYLPPVPPTTWWEAAKRLEATLNRRQALIMRGIELSRQEAL